MMFRRFALLAGLLALSAGPAPAALAQGLAAHGSPRVASRAAPVVPMGPSLIDINSADERALDSLPGVGAVRAKAIIANRPYTDKQELLTKKVVPTNVFAAIVDKVALVNVNTASAADMAKILPNVGPVRADKIVKGRPYGTPQDMVGKGALTQGVYEGIRSLVTTGS